MFTDLFGKMQPDEFSRSLPASRPVVKHDKPARSVANAPAIGLPDTVNMARKCRAMRQGSTFARKGGAIAGATSCGFNAAMGWGEVLPPSRGALETVERVPLPDKVIFKMGTFKSDQRRKQA